MQLHQLQRSHPNKRPRARVGRGGKRGTTSGRGTKGQRSRAGHRIRPAERDFVQRLPKLRGILHKPLQQKFTVVNVKDFARVEGNAVDAESLRKAGLVKGGRTKHIKILGSGTVTRSFVVRNLSVSTQAKKKIEAAGGTIVSTS